MPMIETPLMRGLERVLDVSAFEHQVIATNIANIDTPNFHARGLRSFAGEIEQAMAGGESSTSQAAFPPVAREIHGLLERPDGNNVSLDRESLLLAQNQLRFQVAVQFLKAEFHRLSLAISGGNGS